MPNILLLAPEGIFADDLQEQIKLYASEFNLFREDDGNVLFDLIIIDENYAALKDSLKKYARLPVFVLSAEEDSRLPANVIAKPLNLSRLLDRIKAGIQLHENSQEGYLCFNNYELHPIAKEILNKRNKEVVKLTEKEVAVIKYLYKAKDKIVSRQELLQEVWGYSPEVSTHTIETHIYRLRQKVEHEDESAQLIVTTEGGYRLNGLN